MRAHVLLLVKAKGDLQRTPRAVKRKDGKTHVQTYWTKPEQPRQEQATLFPDLQPTLPAASIQIPEPPKGRTRLTTRTPLTGSDPAPNMGVEVAPMKDPTKLAEPLTVPQARVLYRLTDAYPHEDKGGQASTYENLEARGLITNVQADASAYFRTATLTDAGRAALAAYEAANPGNTEHQNIAKQPAANPAKQQPAERKSGSADRDAERARKRAAREERERAEAERAAFFRNITPEQVQLLPGEFQTLTYVNADHTNRAYVLTDKKYDGARYVWYDDERPEGAPAGTMQTFGGAAERRLYDDLKAAIAAAEAETDGGKWGGEAWGEKRERRTDVHAPSNFNPADYEWHDSIDLQAEVAIRDPHTGQFIQTAEHIRKREVMAEVEANHGGVHGIGRCDHCGAHVRYAHVFRHKPTGKLITVGQECAGGRFTLPDQATFRMEHLRTQAARERQRARDEAKLQEVYAQHPGLQDAIELGMSQWQTHDYFKNSGVFTSKEQDDAREDAEKRMRAGTLANVTYEVDVLQDMRNKALKYGNLSDKQVAFALKLGERIEEKLAAATERAQQAQERQETVTPLEAGRQDLTGRVISTKGTDTPFGFTLKMLLELEGGARVYGTIPQPLMEQLREETGYYDADELKGRRVSLTATVDPKEPDFGFYSRPSKATLLPADAQ